MLRASTAPMVRTSTTPKLSLTIVGPGRLGSALAQALHRIRYRIDQVVYRSGASSASIRTAKSLAREVSSRAVSCEAAEWRSRVIWLCVPDSAIASVARHLSEKAEWRNKVVLHASGALTSAELQPLRERGAKVGSAHPMMTFVARSAPGFADVPFALEGDPAALRVARRMVADLHGTVITISKDKKSLYHAFGAFLSPLIIAELAMAETIGKFAGVRRRELRDVMAPILAQTIANWYALGPAGAFSGPLIRGDVMTVERNLAALEAVPGARQVYVALARAALAHLPARRADEIAKVLQRFSAENSNQQKLPSTGEKVT